MRTRDQTVRRIERVPLHADAGLPDALPGARAASTFRNIRPAGARIDYYLAARRATVTLDILDADGKVVRSFTSEQRAPGGDAARGRRGGGWPSALPTKTGMNRFVWDLRYAGDPPSSASDMEGGGSAAAARWWRPAAYKARLTAGGVTKTESFTVKIDPRVAKDGITVADLAEQTKFALKVRDALAEARQLVAARAPGDGRPNAAIRRQLQSHVGAPDDQDRRRTKIRCSSISCRTSGREIGQADQKVGASAYERFNDLMKEWAALKADAESGAALMKASRA